jgi:hypothetical protein
MGFWSEPFARILAKCVLEAHHSPCGSCGSREMNEQLQILSENKNKKQ